MASSLQQAVTSLRLNDYACRPVVIITTVGYDYLLTFSEEVEYIWNKPWSWVSTLFVLIVFGTLMCLLTIIQFIKELLQVYQVTRRFQLNHYAVHFARDGVIYFIVILVFAVINVMGNAGIIPGDRWILIVLVLAAQQIPPFTLIPRFILSLREVYARDLQGRRGSHLDTAFGLTSRTGHGAAMGEIVFADGGQNEDEEQGDEIQMEERNQRIRRTNSSA